jgi:tetratricopeptide (TPR) repeat protein
LDEPAFIAAIASIGAALVSTAAAHLPQRKAVELPTAPGASRSSNTVETGTSVLAAMEHLPPVTDVPAREPLFSYDDDEQGLALMDQLESRLAQARRSADWLAEANILNHLGFEHEREADFPAALDAHRQALRLYTRNGDIRGRGDTLNNSGIVHARRGQLDLAAELFAEAIALRTRDGDSFGLSRSYCNLAVLDLRLERRDPAKHLCLEMLRLTDEAHRPDTKGRGKALHNLGVLATLDGDFAGAQRLFEQARDLRLRAWDLRGIAKTSNNMGVVSLLGGDPVAATDPLGTALELLETWVHDRLALINVLNNLILAHEAVSRERAVDLRARICVLVEAAHRDGIDRSADAELIGASMSAEYNADESGVLPYPLSITSSSSTAAMNPFEPTSRQLSPT